MSIFVTWVIRPIRYSSVEPAVLELRMTIVTQNRTGCSSAQVSLVDRARRYLGCDSGAVAAEYGIIVSVAALIMVVVAYVSAHGG